MKGWKKDKFGYKNFGFKYEIGFQVLIDGFFPFFGPKIIFKVALSYKL